MYAGMCTPCARALYRMGAALVKECIGSYGVLSTAFLSSTFVRKLST